MRQTSKVAKRRIWTMLAPRLAKKILKNQNPADLPVAAPAVAVANHVDAGMRACSRGCCALASFGNIYG